MQKLVRFIRRLFKKPGKLPKSKRIIETKDASEAAEQAIKKRFKF